MQNKITQAVILSAGFGTRLKPLTDTMPKVMIPFEGRPLLEWHIEHLKKHGITEFFINLFYLPDVVMNYFGDGSKRGVKIHYAKEEPEILGTAGGMKNFSADLPAEASAQAGGGSPPDGRAGASGGDGTLGENFFLIYGDIFSLVDYSRLAEIYLQKPQPNLGMELIRETDHPKDSDLVELDSEMRFKKIYRKPHAKLPATNKGMSGIFIFSNRILKYIPPKTYYEIDHQLLPEILGKGEIFYGCEPSPTDFWKDVGTMERYEKVQEYLKNLKK